MVNQYNEAPYTQWKEQYHTTHNIIVSEAQLSYEECDCSNPDLTAKIAIHISNEMKNTALWLAIVAGNMEWMLAQLQYNEFKWKDLEQFFDFLNLTQILVFLLILPT